MFLPRIQMANDRLLPAALKLHERPRSGIGPIKKLLCNSCNLMETETPHLPRDSVAAVHRRAFTLIELLVESLNSESDKEIETFEVQSYSCPLVFIRGFLLHVQLKEMI